MKMSDVFDLPVSFDVDLCKIYSPSHNLIEAKAISLDAQCYAINSHDRMVEEIAELKGKLLEHKEFTQLMHSMSTDWTVKRSIELHKETEQLLAKLNQEGEELND